MKKVLLICLLIAAAAWVATSAEQAGGQQSQSQPSAAVPCSTPEDDIECSAACCEASGGMAGSEGCYTSDGDTYNQCVGVCAAYPAC